MSQKDEALRLEAFQVVVGAFSKLSKSEQRRLLQSIITFLGLEQNDQVNRRTVEVASHVVPKPFAEHTFSGQPDLSPKQFMLQKEPRSDIERIGCLAYYLTHYRDMPQFKTLDISKLNTEAAQQKFSNAAQALKNTTAKGLIVPAGKGQKQLSAEGEQFVEALPDRDAAKKALERMSSRRRKRNSSARKDRTKAK